MHNKSCLCQEPCSLTGTFWCFQRRYLGFKFPYSQLLTQKIIKKKKKKKSCLYLVHNLLIIIQYLVGSTHPCLFSFKSFCNWYMYRGCPENIYLLLSCFSSIKGCHMIGVMTIEKIHTDSRCSKSCNKPSTAR